MPMSITEFNQFKKVMTLTTSPVDAEALAALRRANAILTARGYTWEQVLNRVIKVEVPIEAADADGDDLAQLFESAMKNARGSFRDTVESIHEKWENTGFLTPRQREVIEAAAQKIETPRFRR